MSSNAQEDASLFVASGSALALALDPDGARRRIGDTSCHNPIENEPPCRQPPRPSTSSSTRNLPRCKSSSKANVRSPATADKAVRRDQGEQLELPNLGHVGGAARALGFAGLRRALHPHPLTSEDPKGHHWASNRNFFLEIGRAHV